MMEVDAGIQPAVLMETLSGTHFDVSALKCEKSLLAYHYFNGWIGEMDGRRTRLGLWMNEGRFRAVAGRSFCLASACDLTLNQQLGGHRVN